MSALSHKTRSLVFAGLCAALGVVLPMAFHAIPGGGGIFLPMHIPVLLCGFLCGPWYGMARGIVAPLVSSLATGMPAAARLPGMLCELAVYGLVSGFLYAVLRRKSLQRPPCCAFILLCWALCWQAGSLPAWPTG